MRLPAAALVLAFLPISPRLAEAASPSVVTRLADAFADQALQAAAGRPVELAPIEDLTDLHAPLARDLAAAVQRKLDRPRRTTGALSARLTAVVGRSEGRLVLAGRLLERATGRLLEVVSASVELDAAGLGALQGPDLPNPRPPFQRRANVRSGPVEGPILALAFLGERLVVLSPAALCLYAVVASSAPERLACAEMPPVTEPVRAPGGVLVAVDAESTVWALVSGAERALLFAADGPRLVKRFEAAALPWPGSMGGLRFALGTHHLEGAPEAFGAQPIVALSGPAAVGAGGALILADGTAPDLRVGSSLTWPWPDILVTSSPAAPGREDRLLFLRTSSPPAVVEELPVEGAVVALASRVSGLSVRVVAGVSEADGSSHLQIVDLERQDDARP